MPLSHLAIYFVLIIGAIGALIPFVYTMSVSLMNLTEATGGRLLPSTPQWGNYLDAWDEANFALYITNSIKITAISVGGRNYLLHVGGLCLCTHGVSWQNVAL